MKRRARAARSRAPARAALIAAAVLSRGCHCSDPSSPLVQDFEGRAGLDKWPRDAPGKVERSTDWKADGEASLRIDPGLLATIGSLRRSDFRGADALRVHVHNTGSELATLGFELQDGHDTLYDRHRRSFGAPPGDSTIDLDLSGDLWRGEENRPYRGPTKTPLDLADISRISFENRGTKTIYIDALTLVTEPLAVPHGAFAFDFGKRGSRVMGKTTGIFEDSAYAAEQGYGWTSGKRSFLRSFSSLPTPLLGDGLAWEDSVFQVDLPGGPYVGWIAFERSGFWEAEGDATGYEQATFSVNGTLATTHRFSPAGPHFFFEDVEVVRMEDAAEKLIWRAHAISRFTFQAQPGPNRFTLSDKGRRGPPLRVAGLFIAPDTPEGRQFVGAQEERQKRAIEAAFPKTDRARRPPDAAPIAAPITIERRPTGEIAHPRDLPGPPSKDPGIVSAIAGHNAYAQLAFYAPRPTDVTLTATLGSATTQVGTPRLLSGIYGPKRPYEGGAAWIETQYYRPLDETGVLQIAPEVCRSVLVEFDVPKTAPAGLATVFVRAWSGPQQLAEFPLTVEVSTVDLPPLPIATGLFMSALPFAPDALEVNRWWELQEQLLALQGEAGLNTPTGGPGLEYTMKPAEGGYSFAGDNALRYLEIARKYGMDKAVVGYSGFLPSIKHERPDAALFQKSWSDFESTHHLPPHYLYAYDEPGTDSELAEVAAYLLPFQKAGTRTIGFFSHADSDSTRAVLDATFAPAVSTHTPALVKDWVARGKQVFLYNRGTSRLSMGPDLVSMIHLGITGRLEWIGLYTQGFAFDDLDAREPSYGMFVVHDRLGILPTPRWLSLHEGLTDARLQLAQEALPPITPPDWPTDYPASPTAWPDEKLDSARKKTLQRLSAAAAPK